MKAITTKYHGFTNTRASRISASDSDGNKVSIPYDHALSSFEVHVKAALTLCQMKTGMFVSDDAYDGQRGINMTVIEVKFGCP